MNISTIYRECLLKFGSAKLKAY